MTGSMWTVIFVPVAAAIGLAVWLTVVMYVSNHPQGKKPGSEPRQDIIGGIFRGDPRQQMPQPGVPASDRTMAGAATARQREEDQR